MNDDGTCTVNVVGVSALSHTVRTEQRTRHLIKIFGVTSTFSTKYSTEYQIQGIARIKANFDTTTTQAPRKGGLQTVERI